MSHDRERPHGLGDPVAPVHDVVPGKATRSQRLEVQRRLRAPAAEAAEVTSTEPTAALTDDPFGLHVPSAPVQRKGHGAGPDAVHAAAAAGLEAPATALPHQDTIQASFGGDHDLSRIQAHVGGTAAVAARAIGAEAYATGDHVAFAAPPALHTAAHEAAHVVQQARGVQLLGGVGVAGDAYERHADAVADRVVAGTSAAELLAAGPTGGGGSAVQRKDTTTNVPLTETSEQAVGQVGASIQSVFSTPYPEHRNYPGPPTQASEIENRLRGYGVQRGPTDEEKEWLYQAATALGLLRLVDQYKNRADAGKAVNPARANVVAFALSQVGLVEAHTAAPDPDNPGKTSRKGYKHLRQYYVETGRAIDEGVLHDPSIKVGPEGGNRIGSWCQIFSEWAVKHGGGTFKIGGNQVTRPQPGDVAYMHQAEHMAVVVSVEGEDVTTVDGNMPGASAIMVCTRKLSVWNQGFHDSFPGT